VNVHLYSRHYNGKKWDPERKIDHLTEPSDVRTLAGYSYGIPWVVFDGGYGNLVDPFDVWCSHYVLSSVNEVGSSAMFFQEMCLPSIVKGNVIVEIPCLKGVEGVLKLYELSGRLKEILW